MNETILLEQILRLKKENEALKRSLWTMLDRLKVKNVSCEPTMWELYSPDFDRDVDTAEKLLFPDGSGKTLQ